jgi:type IV secretory pathway TraG/TraD family ATPase VirD4
VSQRLANRHCESRGRDHQRRRILDVAEPASLPKGRAVILAAGAPPALVRTLPWMTGPRAADVRLSLRQYDPSAASTLAHAEASLADVRAAEPLNVGGRA